MKGRNMRALEGRCRTAAEDGVLIKGGIINL